MPLLDVRDIVFSARTDGPDRVLDGLSLAVEPGEVHALLGANGTGKSTLAGMIMGCGGLEPRSGEILFAGRSLAGLQVHERARLGISMAWQEPVRFEGITVSDFIAIRGRDAEPGRCLALAGLDPARYGNRLVDRSLSGGERKRIELASILALHPKLAILDEPDSGIDLLSTQDIINVLSAFRQDGASVLLITHREEVALSADRASQLCSGRVVCSGAPAKVAEHFRSRQCLTCTAGECQDV